MGSPTFGFVGGNNAPPPMFGSFTNPTGGVMGKGTTGGFSFPLFGTPSSGMVSPSANLPLFGGTNDPMMGLSSGFDLGNNWQSFANMLGKAYGKGPGQAIYNILSEGLFNPKTAEAFINAMQPSVNRGEANLLQSFGAEGSRFGSAAALGQGDFLSQVNLNEQQTLAQMYMQAQQEQLQLLEGVLPTMHAERANSGGLFHDILGALEIAGGAIAAPFTGGASLPLVGSGVGTLAGGLDHSSGSSGGFSNLFGGGGLPGFGGNTGTFGMGAPSFGGNNGFDWNQLWNDMQTERMSSSAGSLFGGTTDVPALLGQ